jgi:predicted PolB exonuclease-like 3'-5' exonuclease
MDVIAGYNNRAFAPLDEIAVLLSLPGKMGMSGSKVWDQYKDGQIKAIRDYCETDALNTYLVYLHWQFLRGELSEASLEQEYQTVKKHLSEAEPHLQEFLQVWQGSKS